MEAPSCTILLHVKNNLQEDFARPNSSFPLPIPPACYQVTLLVGLPESSDGQISSFPLSTSFRHVSPCTYMTWGMNNRPVDVHSSEK
jgi:hypothetical protein